MPASSLLFLTLCAAVVSALTHEVNLYHRVFVPSVSSRGHPVILPAWVPRGTAEILSSRFATYSSVSNLNEDLAVYRSRAASQPLALYQVALELPGVQPNLWPFSSVKAVCSCIPASLQLCESPRRRTIPDSSCFQCHLTDKTTDSIRIHVGNDAEHTQYAISYWINNIPADGACPITAQQEPSPRITNTTVSVHSPTILPR